MANRNFMTKGVLLIGALALFGAGCGGGSADVADRGVFRSPDNGDSWGSASAVLTTGDQPVSLHASVDVLGLIQDPVDDNVIYARTRRNGLLYSLDSGASWTSPPDELVTSGLVYGLTINPQNPCELYAAINTKVFKSTTCARSWSEVFDAKNVGGEPDLVTALALNPNRPNEIYAATKSGKVIRSPLSGAGWTTIKIFEDRIMDVLIDPVNPNRVFVALQTTGMWRTDDAGAEWKDISPDGSEYFDSNVFSEAMFDLTARDTLITASKYGLLRTTDAGDTWTPITLLNAPGEVDIFSIAMNPSNANQMYYGTTNAFYRTADGGQIWEVKKIPTTKALTALMVDRTDPKVVYFGATDLTQ